MVVGIDLGMSVVGRAAAAADRTRTGRDLRVAEDMKFGRRFAAVGSRMLKTDLGRRMLGNRKDLAIAVRRNLQNHPL